MKEIAPLIIEEGTEHLEIEKRRDTVRAIIMRDQRLLMVYSDKLNDYTFPGGGVKYDEDKINALKRELKEELGAHDVFDIKPYGFMQEKRFGISNQKTVYLQTSYYYLCQVDKLGEQSLVDREKAFGVEPRWIDVMDAIRHNENTMKHSKLQQGMGTVLPREMAVLKDIKEYLK